MIKKLILIFSSIWWGWTALTDFAVVPTVFQIVPDFFVAGELGIALFSKLNLLEVIVASLLVGLSIFQIKKYHSGKLQLLCAAAAFIIVMVYFSFLTEKIVTLTELWKKADQSGQMGIAGIVDIQQEHQFYHRIYVGLDSLKLLFLTFIIAINLFRKDKVLEQA